MSDPLSDPRATDLLSADPGEVWALAGVFRQVAGEAESTASGLRSAHVPSWTGLSADAFHRTIGKLPGELDKVQRSYQNVADALDAYESELATVKPAFQRLVQQLGAARSSLSGAQTSLSGAQNNLSSALQTPNAKPTSPAVQSAHDAVANASGAVGRLQGEVGGLEGQGFALLDRFQSARDGCAAKVSRACSVAPHQSWWDHMMHDVGNWMSDAGHFLAGVGKGIWNGVTGLPGALVGFVEHPSWKTFAKLAEDVAITASVVLLVTGVGELLLPEEAAGALALDEASSAAGVVAKGAGYAGVGAGAGQGAEDAAHGNYRGAAGEFASSAISALVMQAPELGDALPGARAAEEAGVTANALSTYANGVGSGQTEVQALFAMSSADRQLVVESARVDAGGMGTMLSMSREDRLAFLQNLANPTPMVDAATQNAKLLQIASLPGKTAVNFGVDKLINDPVSKGAQARINHALGVKAEG